MSGKHAITRESIKEGQTRSGRAKNVFPFILSVGAGIVMILSWISYPTSSWAAAGETSDHLSKVLEIPLEGESIPKKLSFPLYEQNNIQYFSAGLGKEERSLSYPPYALKLIFVKGERAFLTSVDIEVLQHDRTNLISIPGEEVQGPWVFINLPAGKYVLKATDSSGITLEKVINLSEKRPSTVHFRWP